MADPDPRPDPRGDAGVSDSGRVCPACGEKFSGPFHSPCPMDSKTIKDPTRPPTTKAQTKRSLDALPEEAVPHAEDPERRLNQYILVRLIGQGGMGAVWKAWDRKLTRWVAIKFLLAGLREGLDRFEREARLAARIHHPNIAAIHEVGEAPSRQLGQPGSPYLVMEFIDGQTLASIQLPRREVVEIFLKIGRAIDVAHRGGVVHRDLKPLNIMVTREHWPYVMDFGLAKANESDSSLSQSGAVMGTPAYMSPEQAEGRLSDVDARSDIYSLGATMYSVLLGRPPFQGQSTLEVLRKVSADPVPPPRQLQPDLPEDLEKILLRALAKAPADRYQTAGAFADDLALHLERGRGSSLLPTDGAGAPPKPRKTGLLVGAVIVAALIAAGVMLRPTPPPPAKDVVDERPVHRPVRFPEAAPSQETFALKIAVHPYAEVVQATADGKPVTLDGRVSPVILPRLPLADYEFVLRHPRLGEKKVSVPRNTLTAGKTYVLWGRMENAELRVSESP